jgi:hypothetical protein
MFERDGYSCVISGVKFNNAPDGNDFNPIVAQVIPNSVHGKVGFMGINDLGLDWVIDAHFKHHHVSIFNLKFFIY